MVFFQTKTTLCAIIVHVVSTEATTVHYTVDIISLFFNKIKPMKDVHAVRLTFGYNEFPTDKC